MGITSSIPPSYGTDWSAMTYLKAEAYSTSTTLSTLMNISGSGYLMSVFHSTDYSTSQENCQIVITIDGSVFHTMNTVVPLTTGSFSISPHVRFNTSLKIQFAAGGGGYNGTENYATAIYTLD